MIQCNSPSGSHTPKLGQMHHTVAAINRILFLPSKTEHPRSTHPAVTFIWRMLHTIFMVDLTAWPPPPNDPRTKNKILHEVCPTHSHRQETSPASRSSKLIVFAYDSASTFHIPSTELNLHDIVRICLHHHHIEEDELEALNQEKKTVCLLKSKFQLICRSQCHPKIQSIGETQQKPGWPSPIHPLIPLMPQTALRRNVPATNQVPIHPRKQDLCKLHLSEIPSLDPKIQSLLQHKPKYQTNGESQQNPKFKCFGDNQPGPKFQPLLQPMIPQLQSILEIPCSNPSPTPSTNFTGRRIVVMF
jgi:hypothetical protein